MLSTEKNVNVMEVSHLVSPTPHMGYLTFWKYDFPNYVLFYVMETPIFITLGFLVTISSTLNYVPT